MSELLSQHWSNHSTIDSWCAYVAHTYIIFEVPSNLVMTRTGARRWIARIMISWGIVSACMALVQGEKSFIIVRLLLGAAEAGFTPGIIWYLPRWFPGSHRGRAMGWFYVGANIAGLAVTPLIGVVREASGSFDAPLLVIAAAMFLGAVVAMVSERFTTPGRLASETTTIT